MFLGSRARPVSRADNLTDCLDNVGSSTSHNPIGFHDLVGDSFTFFTWSILVKELMPATEVLRTDGVPAKI
jgi:hypothetical protein